MLKFKTYTEMLGFTTWPDRLEYLKLYGSIGNQTFGAYRWLNQHFYTSREWELFRNDIIIRDDGCDLAIPGYDLHSKNMYVHHIIPVTKEMIQNRDPLLFDPENVVLVSYNTHAMIHYGDVDSMTRDMADRKPNDTCLWKGGN